MYFWYWDPYFVSSAWLTKYGSWIFSTCLFLLWSYSITMSSVAILHQSQSSTTTTLWCISILYCDLSTTHLYLQHMNYIPEHTDKSLLHHIISLQLLNLLLMSPSRFVMSYTTLLTPLCQFITDFFKHMYSTTRNYTIQLSRSAAWRGEIMWTRSFESVIPANPTALSVFICDVTMYVWHEQAHHSYYASDNTRNNIRNTNITQKTFLIYWSSQKVHHKRIQFQYYAYLLVVIGTITV